jgi:HEAT repeat protein
MPFVRTVVPEAPRTASLDDADAALRRLAVADCADSERLLARLDLEPDPGVRHAILTRLGGLSADGQEHRLAALLASEDVATRNDAVLALRRRGTAALPALDAALRSPDPDVRILAANALEGMGLPAARAAIVRLLAQEPDERVCLAAVEALAQIGEPEDEAVLRAIRRRFPDEPCLAFAIGMALDHIGALA